jgi:endonuclease/exonuclease/phosphatase family metal-dependent hydrolase
VLTFNVCGHAQGCGSWSRREAAVVKRIAASRADVVTVQEVWGVLDRLEQRLAPHGYVMVASSGNEGMFAKASKISPVTSTTIVPDCTTDRLFPGPGIDTAEWVRPSHADENGVVWTYSRRTGWYRDVTICVDQAVETAKNGQMSLGSRSGQAGAAWAMLRVKRTNKAYLFVSAHLTTGKDKVSRKRSAETIRLLAATAVASEGRPRVFSGDFNSSIQRGRDTVGARMRRAGFSDAYVKSGSRAGAKYNSATGHGKRPRVGGSHIDRVFVPRGATVTRWALDVRVRGGKSVRPIPSDHSPVRVSLALP